MRLLPLVLVLFSFSINSCSENGCKPVRPDVEEPQMLAFASTNGITATKHQSGLYYQILNPGSGVTPTLSSKVYVTYVGKHMDGTVFDQTNTVVSFFLSDLLEGWKIGLPLIRKGGHILLIVPSSLAYGCSSTSGAMPPNSILYFDIQLIDVQ
ncbi:MAG TPA: FKBP-type peptidyl-prolyl cis-trans isomerase [Chitinophagaceae bacterium]